MKIIKQVKAIILLIADEVSISIRDYLISIGVDQKIAQEISELIEAVLVYWASNDKTERARFELQELIYKGRSSTA